MSRPFLFLSLSLSLSLGILSTTRWRIPKDMFVYSDKMINVLASTFIDVHTSPLPPPTHTTDYYCMCGYGSDTRIPLVTPCVVVSGNIHKSHGNSLAVLFLLLLL